MKAVVVKLSGFAKFELDHKLTSSHFCTLMDSLATDGENGFSQELFDQYLAIFDKALVEGAEPFKGDLDNEQYKTILQAFRDLQMDWSELVLRINIRINCFFPILHILIFNISVSNYSKKLSFYLGM